MMTFPVILAHGALGAADEIILVAVAVGFLLLMVLSFLRSRNTNPDDEDVSTPETTTDQPDRFRLD